MRYRSTYFEIKDLIIQFTNAFDSIVIGRYNKNRVEQDRIYVRYLYSPKQRVLYDIVNKAKNITLPVVSVSIGSISRDNERVFNKLPDVNGFYYGDTSGTSSKYNAPTPINIDVNLSVITRYQLDMDQILSNFIPYNNPYIIISWPLPTELTGLTQVQELRSEVLWSGNISMSYPLELNGGDKARITADTSFIIKGWVFPYAQNNVDNIYKVTSNFYAVSGGENSGTVLTTDNYPALDSQLSGLSSITETITISAFPDEIEVFRSQQ
jgi:hypothetical protein